jgi:hypothetical protein
MAMAGYEAALAANAKLILEQDLLLQNWRHTRTPRSSISMFLEISGFICATPDILAGI